MKIGIIGAGIAGLTAGRILSKAGHDVTVYEKSRGLGGRLSTRRTHHSPPFKIDHGAPYLTATTDEFRSFISELEKDGIVQQWTDTFGSYSQGTIYPESPGRESGMCYVAPQGMSGIGKYLGRWVDIQLREKIGGLTHVGGASIKKRPWMINSSTINVFEVDAVIIATPAIQAYGLISTAQDEINLRRMISILDDINYSSTFALMAGYGKRDPVQWKGLICEHPVISWICNESSKRDNSESLNMVAHASSEYTKDRYNEYQTEQVGQDMLTAAGEIMGKWAENPEWHSVHLWRYKIPSKRLDIPFMESEDDWAPLALVGDYFQGSSLEAAYLSGLRLGEHWASKFS